MHGVPGRRYEIAPGKPGDLLRVRGQPPELAAQRFPRCPCLLAGGEVVLLRLAGDSRHLRGLGGLAAGPLVEGVSRLFRLHRILGPSRACPIRLASTSQLRALAASIAPTLIRLSSSGSDGSSSQRSMSITFFMFSRWGGECSSRFVITTAPWSIAPAMDVLFARTP